MASQLHARRKQHDLSGDEEDPEPDTPAKESGIRRNNSFSPRTDKDHGRTVNPLLVVARTLKQYTMQEGANETRAALLTVVAFLIVGICLGYFLLQVQHQRVILHVMKNPWAHGGAVLKGRAGFQHHFYSGAPRYVTVVMPSVVNPKDRPRRLKAIQETWGPYARSIFVISNSTEFPAAAHHKAVISETEEPGDPFSYPQALMVPPSIGDENGVPRLKYVIQTVYEKVNPDFGFFVNDHTFVIPEHLCYYLQDLDPLDDLYAGHAMKTDEYVFNSGAAGYLLSRSTMKKLVQMWKDEHSACSIDPEDKKTKWLQGNPGLLTTYCLKNGLNISAIDTREDGKYHRFHAFSLTRQVSGKLDQWFFNKHTEEMAAKIGADASYATLLTGEECCAKSTISFHYVETHEAKALFATRERLLANPLMSDKELKSLMLAEWPKDKKDVGFYSHQLPDHANHEEWKPLLKTMRRITMRETQREC